jgi:predicted RNA binding protein YcfA (HicA-like mRNA interferase family)
MKIMLFDPKKDLPLKTIEKILQQAIDLYKNGVIKIKG